MPPAPILTGDPVPGIDTYFALGEAATPTVVKDISDFLDGIDTAEDTEELDASTFRKKPKRMLAGATTVSYTLSGKWSEDAHTFFAPLRGMTNVSFEYGPAGPEVGKTKIAGTVTVLSVTDPIAAVDAVTTFTVELKVLTRTAGTFAA